MTTLKRLLSTTINGTQHFLTDGGWTPLSSLDQAWFDDQDENEIHDMVFNGNFKSLVDEEGMTDCDFFDEDEGINVCLDTESRSIFKEVPSIS